MTDARSFDALGVDAASSSSSSAFWHPSTLIHQGRAGELATTQEMIFQPGSLPSEGHPDTVRIPMKQRWSTDAQSSNLLSRTSSPRTSPPSSPRRTPPPGPPRMDPQHRQHSGILEETTARLRRFSVNTAIAVTRKMTTSSTYISPIRRSALFVLSLDSSLPAHFVSAVLSVISNKYLLRGYFPFPWFLISLQMCCATVAMVVARATGLYSPNVARLSRTEERTVKLCAFLFSCEQLTSILGLRLMNVPFHLSVRSLAPALTLVLSICFFGQRSSLRTTSCFFIILTGVGLTSHSIPDIHSFGSLLTFLSMLLASGKTLVNTHVLQDRLHLHPLDLVARMSPLAMVHALCFAVLNGEMSTMGKFVTGPDFTLAHVGAIALNAILSLLAVMMSILTDARTQPPSLAISGHASQACTIVVATFVFGLSLSFINFVGVTLTLIGGSLLSWNEALDAPPPPLPPGKLLPD